MAKTILTEEKKVKEKKVKEKEFKFRECYKTQVLARKQKGWILATEEEKAKYGNRRGMGGVLTLMKKEVA